MDFSWRGWKHFHIIGLFQIWVWKSFLFIIQIMSLWCATKPSLRPRSLWEHGHGHHSAAFGAKPEGQAVLPNPHLFGTDDSGHHDSAINSNDASLYIFRANWILSSSVHRRRLTHCQRDARHARQGEGELWELIEGGGGGGGGRGVTKAARWPWNCSPASATS